MLQHVVATRRAVIETATRITFTTPRIYASTETGQWDGIGQHKKNGPPLVNFFYEPFPQPFNCTTQHPTRTFAADPCHPFFIKIQRRVAAQKPEEFVWVTRCPMDVSKKPAYRHSVQKRLSRAFKAALRQRGYDEDGRSVDEQDMTRTKAEAEHSREGMTPAEKAGRLSGALAMFFINDQKRVLQAKGDEIRSEAERILDSVLQIRYAAQREQEKGRPMQRPRSLSGHDKRHTAQEWQLGLKKEPRATHVEGRRPPQPDWQR